MKKFKVAIEQMAKDTVWIIKWVLKECSIYLLIFLADWTSYNSMEHTMNHLKKEQLLFLCLVNNTLSVIVIGDNVFQRIQTQEILKFL